MILTNKEIEEYVIKETSHLSNTSSRQNIRAAMIIAAKWARDQQPNLEEIIHTLCNGSFEGWSDDAINGYKTACVSILARYNSKKT